MKKANHLALAVLSLALSACSLPQASTSGSIATVFDSDTANQVEAIYQIYVKNASSKSQTPLSYEDWLASIKGEKGDPGKNGTSLLTGRGEPSANTGANGDSYIDLDTWNFYTKASGSWSLAGNISGANQGDGAATIKIPDITGLDETTAKTFIVAKGLIPKIVYDYDNTQEKGNVVKTSPEIGAKVSEDTTVTVTVSKGPRYYSSVESTAYIKSITDVDPFVWGKDVGYDKATKRFYNPYVEEGFLYIQIFIKCTSRYKIEFCRADDEATSTYGLASLNSDFSDLMTTVVLFDDYKVDNYGEETSFKVKISLDDIGTEKPKDVYIKVPFLVGGTLQYLEAGFTMTW